MPRPTVKAKTSAALASALRTPMGIGNSVSPTPADRARKISTAGCAPSSRCATETATGPRDRSAPTASAAVRTTVVRTAIVLMGGTVSSLRVAHSRHAAGFLLHSAAALKRKGRRRFRNSPRRGPVRQVQAEMGRVQDLQENGAGTCATCAEVCAKTWEACFTLADGARPVVTVPTATLE